jgi:hypothetical protein
VHQAAKFVTVGSSRMLFFNARAPRRKWEKERFFISCIAPQTSKTARMYCNVNVSHLLVKCPSMDQDGIIPDKNSLPLLADFQITGEELFIALNSRLVYRFWGSEKPRLHISSRVLRPREEGYNSLWSTLHGAVPPLHPKAIFTNRRAPPNLTISEIWKVLDPNHQPARKRSSIHAYTRADSYQGMH